MDISAAKRLFDITTRQAMFIEQVKMGETERLAATLQDLEKDLIKILGRLKYTELDSLSKAKLNILIAEIKASQSRIYSRYQLQVLDRLRDFMAATTVQTMRLSASVYSHTGADDDVPLLSEEESREVIYAAAEEKENNGLFGLLVLAGTNAATNAMWSKVKNAPLPSGGSLLLNFVNFAFANDIVKTEAVIRNAWVNKKTVSELKADLVGGTNKTKDAEGKVSEEIVKGSTARFNTAMGAVLATVIQHTAQQAISAVNSTLWPRYVWVSVIDGVTSDICRKRNGKTWVYGKGPIPPAHVKCRSHTMPFEYYNPDFEMPTFYEWLKEQPDGFITSVFGSTIAAKFKSGSIRAADFDKFNPATSKTIVDFLNGTDKLI